MYCTKCKSLVVKNGKTPKGIQRYYCKECKFSFQKSYYYKAYYQNTDTYIVRLLKEGCGVRSIGRILQISKNTVLSRMLAISSKLTKPMFSKKGCVFEMDEMWSYISNKKQVVWLTYVLEQESKEVINFYIGKKTKEVIKPLIDAVLLLKPKTIYTDKLNVYPSLIPQELHSTQRYRTNRIERMNLTLRTHIKRLTRKTICFSKSISYFKAHVMIYFFG